eukprot:TRINITY_DN2375_c0_g1_i1.p1 TRINITY_DN2375_c0_g1~~TRINITY_DN2375_c0_g1_i1.p1  ORF type:complete len:212 (-),score=48.51 TRINITY_DN2375_c0_g1_i1:96-731(-)
MLSSRFFISSLRVPSISSLAPTTVTSFQPIAAILCRTYSQREGRYDDDITHSSRFSKVQSRGTQLKKIRHRKAVDKRIIQMKRDEAKKHRDQDKYDGMVFKEQTTDKDMNISHGRPKKFHNDEEVELIVKRKELRRLMPFKEATLRDPSMWKILSNKDKKPTDEVIRALMKEKHRREEKAEPGSYRASEEGTYTKYPGEEEEAVKHRRGSP